MEKRQPQGSPGGCKGRKGEAENDTESKKRLQTAKMNYGT